MILQILLALCEELSLPSWMACNLKAAHDEASSVPEDREIQYSLAWNAYHQFLDSDSDLTLLSMAYGQQVRLPIFERIDATGAFVFWPHNQRSLR